MRILVIIFQNPLGKGLLPGPNGKELPVEYLITLTDVQQL